MARAQAYEQVPPDTLENNYHLGKVSVWWDIENCQVSKKIKKTSIYTITCNIMLALKKIGHHGEISIYVYGNCNGFDSELQMAMTSNGVRLMHVTPGEDAADKRMITDMIFWGHENPAPATYLLISGDRDFSYVLETLDREKYKVMIACSQNINLDYLSFPTTTWDLNSLLSGGLPNERM